MEIGDSFWMGNPKGKTKHLWVVISDKHKHGGNCVAVNFTKDEIRACGECLTFQNEHSSLTEPKSWVTFGDALEITSGTYRKFSMLAALSPPGFAPANKAPLPCVAKLIAGAKTSTAFPIIYLKYLA
jgi:hypothetical protein